jgi:hypothetical protein
MIVTESHRSSHQVELVAGQQPTASRPRLLNEYLADGVDAGGVQARQRFVEDQQLRSVDQRGGKLHPLLVAV